MELCSVVASESPEGPGRLRLVGEVRYERGEPARETYWFDLPAETGGATAGRGDPWLVALLPLGVASGEPVRVGLPTDERLQEGARRLMRVWSSWYEDLRPVPLEIETGDTDGGPNRRVGAFFSGGVDSSFTAVRPREAASGAGAPVNDLISVWGFDIPLSAPDAFRRFRRRASESAAELGKGFIHASTNLRETRWDRAPWGPLAHGCALAAIALALQGTYRAVLIAATGGYRDLHPWGSHPLTDPLLSTAATSIVHDGASFTRLEKITTLLRWPDLLRRLRVCWETRTEESCGQCMKCQRTMIALELLGALEGCPAFPTTVDRRRVRRLRCRHSWDFREFRDLVELAEKRGRTDLARALRGAMRRSALRNRAAAVLGSRP